MSAASCASRSIAGAARRPHDPDLLRAPVAHRALAAAGRDRALGRGRPRASRRPPTARRGSSSGGRSPPAATCSSSTCAAPAGRSRSTARPSGSHILGYIARAARCAAQLGPARDAYDTSQSVQDLAAVLRALHIGRVDLYGDSYGSYAAAGVRAPLSGQAALARARRHLSAAGLRPGAGRPRRQHAERASAGVRAPARMPGRTHRPGAGRRAACRSRPPQSDRRYGA